MLLALLGAAGAAGADAAAQSAARPVVDVVLEKLGNLSHLQQQDVGKAALLVLLVLVLSCRLVLVKCGGVSGGRGGGASNGGRIRVEVSRRPLSGEEKEMLAPDLLKRKRSVNPELLDVLPPKGRSFRLLRALDAGTDHLLGVTVAFCVNPSAVCLKTMMGEGNHVGWDVGFYVVSEDELSKSGGGVTRSQVVAAILNEMASMSYFYGYYFGLLDSDLELALRHKSNHVPYHRLYKTDYRTGSVFIPEGMSSADDFLAEHRQLSRNVRRFARAGGIVRRVEGVVDDRELAESMSDCVEATLKHHALASRTGKGHGDSSGGGGSSRMARKRGGGGAAMMEAYAHETCAHFYRTCKCAVHVYAEIDGEVVGCQSYVRHSDRLELSEGGFSWKKRGRGDNDDDGDDADDDGAKVEKADHHHAYEAILVESVQCAIDHGLGRVSYGGVWNATKDRYTSQSPEDREPLYVLFVYGSWWKFHLFGDWFLQRYQLNRLAKMFAGGGHAFQLVSDGADDDESHWTTAEERRRQYFTDMSCSM